MVLGARARYSNAMRTTICVVVATLLAVVFAACPSNAFADYANPSVKTTAQARTNGSLHVVELRAFAFDSEYSVIAWPVSNSSKDQVLDVQSISLIQTDESGNASRNDTPFTEAALQTSWRSMMEKTGGNTAAIDDLRIEADKGDAAHRSANYVAPFKAFTYAYDARERMIYIFLDPVSNDLTIECDYVIENAAQLYDDTSELYWDYACAWPDAEARNISAEIQLPVPDGDTVEPGVNVFAWGHGPEGSVAISADGTINFEVEDVQPGLSAYAHVLFPKSWLSNIVGLKKLNSTGMRFDSAMAEEKSWIDTSAGWWINRYTVEVLLLALSLVSLVSAVILYALFGRKHEASGSNVDHEVNDLDGVVIARLMRWNNWSIDDFSTSIKDISKAGAIRILEDADHVDATRFISAPRARMTHLTKLQKLTTQILFDDFGMGYESVSLSEIEKYCRSTPETVKALERQWQHTLSREIDDAGLFDRRSFTAARWTWVIALFVLVLALIEMFGVGGPWPALLMLLIAVAVGAIAYYMPRLTQLGADMFEVLKRRMSEASTMPADSKPNDLTMSADSKPADQAIELEELAPWQVRLDEILSSALLPKPVKKPRRNRNKDQAND